MSQEINGVVPIRQSRCKHVWAPSPAGDEHGKERCNKEGFENGIQVPPERNHKSTAQ